MRPRRPKSNRVSYCTPVSSSLKLLPYHCPLTIITSLLKSASFLSNIVLQVSRVNQRFQVRLSLVNFNAVY